MLFIVVFVFEFIRRVVFRKNNGSQFGSTNNVRLWNGNENRRNDLRFNRNSFIPIPEMYSENVLYMFRQEQLTRSERYRSKYDERSNQSNPSTIYGTNPQIHICWKEIREYIQDLGVIYCEEIWTQHVRKGVSWV